MIIFPGSDWFLILRYSSQKGVRNGAIVAIGLGLGSLFITLLAIGGLNSLFVAYPNLIQIIRYLGVAWFIWQAIITFFPHKFSPTEASNKKLDNPLLSGFINHAFNVEMILFYIAIISQLTKSSGYPLQITAAFIMAAFTVGWFIFIAQASQRVKIVEKILSYPVARIIIGVLFLVSAITLYLAH